MALQTFLEKRRGTELAEDVEEEVLEEENGVEEEVEGVIADGGANLGGEVTDADVVLGGDSHVSDENVVTM